MNGFCFRCNCVNIYSNSYSCYNLETINAFICIIWHNCINIYVQNISKTSPYV